jgi:AcrR family transcriptional regulator
MIMPKETFYNLSEEKRQRIFQAAVSEFASHKFSEASLNRIVKAAKIPWGSFYQYFEDKEDLYLYVIKEMSKYKWDALKQAGVENMVGDFFDTIREKIAALFELRKHNPDYAQIALLQEMDDDDFVRKVRGDSTKRWKEIIERDKKRGIIKSEIDADVMIDMFYNYVLLNFYKVGLDEEKFMATLDEAIKIMREGVSVK